MDIKDIRPALQRLVMLAERAGQPQWPSAIERDLMLAELREIYQALLCAAPAAATQQPAAVQPVETAAETVAPVETPAVAAVVAAAVAEIREAEQTDGEAAADIEPLDLEGDFDDAPEPAAEPEPMPAPEPVAEPVAVAAPTPEPPAEPAPAEEPAAVAEAAEAKSEEVAESAAGGVEATVENGTTGAKNLLFDLGTIQHRTHRRMMSLYDDETFDRLPDTPAASAPAPAPAQTPAYKRVEAEPEDDNHVQPAPEPEPEPAPVPEPAKEEVVYETEPIDDNHAQPAPEPEPEPTPESAPAPEEVVYMAEPEDDNHVQPAPEPEPEPEPESAPAPSPVRTVGELYAQPAETPQAAPAVLGDVMNSDVEVLGDTLAPQESIGDTLAHAPVTGGLATALDLSERYQIIAELFGGDADACDAALAQLDAMESLEDAVIYIEENFRWNPSSSAAALMMDLLDRKFS